MPVVHVKERMRECVRQKMQRAILEMELFLSGKKKKKSLKSKAATRPLGGCSSSTMCANWSTIES